MAQTQDPAKERTQAGSVIKGIVKHLASKRTITIKHDDIWTIASENDVYVDMVVKALSKEMNTIVVKDSKGFSHYLVLPNDIELTNYEIGVIESIFELAVSPIYGVRIPENRGNVDVDYVVAYYLFKRDNIGLALGDPLAWLLRRIAESYNVKPDEEIVEWENKEDDTWSKVFRYGDTKIRVKRDYMDKGLPGLNIGTGMVIFYEFA